MLLLQTAFDQEFKAVSRAAGTSQVLMTGIGPRSAREQLSSMLDRIERPELVLSIGLAGGLSPELSCGQSLLIDRVVTLDDSLGITANLERLSSNLRERMRVQSLLTLSAPALTAQAKQRLAEQSVAAACDMETHAVASVCRERQLPWIGARVISDACTDNIPAWILTLPRLIEQKQWPRLAARVATHPQDFPGLIRLALRMRRLETILTQLTTDLIQHVLPS